MRHEFRPTEETKTENPAMSALRREEAVGQAHRYLAQFSPLLYTLQTEDPAECRAALQTLNQLKRNEEQVLHELEQYAEPQDTELITTLQSAISQADLVEEQVRKRLAFLEPGATEGMVDLASLRDRLAKVAAQQELSEVSAGVLHTNDSAGLRLELSKGGWGVAAGLGIFALGWLAFTTFHATFMIGGMFRAVGPAALFLLLFYAIFFSVGGGMAIAALDAASEETVEIVGRELVVRKKLGTWIREKRYQLGPNSRAGRAVANFNQNRGRGVPNVEIAMVDAQGKEFRFGRSCPDHMRQQYIDRINNYVKRALREV